MTDKRQKAKKVKCKCNQSINNETVNICGIHSSLEEAFEFCWSLLASKHNTYQKSTWRNEKFEQICVWNPMTTGFIM